MDRARAFVRHLLKLAFPTCVVLVPTLVFQGTVSPWPPARPVLARHGGQLPLLVGIESHGRGSAAQVTRLVAAR